MPEQTSRTTGNLSNPDRWLFPWATALARLLVNLLFIGLIFATVLFFADGFGYLSLSIFFSVILLFTIFHFPFYLFELLQRPGFSSETLYIRKSNGLTLKKEQILKIQYSSRFPLCYYIRIESKQGNLCLRYVSKDQFKAIKEWAGDSIPFEKVTIFTIWDLFELIP